MASRRVLRETPSRSASSRSGGSCSPTTKTPSRMAVASCSTVVSKTFPTAGRSTASGSRDGCGGSCSGVMERVCRGNGPQVNLYSREPGQPAVAVLGAPVLDVEQGAADGGGDLAPARAGGGGCGAALPAQLADGGDHGRRAAGEDLADLAARDALLPLLDGDAPLLRLQPELLGQL